MNPLKPPSKGVDAAGICFFRAIFGAVMIISATRFWLNGWIEAVFIQPSYHFKFPFFEWVATPTSASVVYVVIFAQALFSLFITIGLYPRLSCAIFFLLFSWTQLWERTIYINHYYLISILAFMFIWIPSAGCFSVKPNKNQELIDPRCYLVVKIMVASVYFYAGIAKINYDWLFRGQPLVAWLREFKTIFTLGGIIPLKWTAVIMGWCGMLYDTTVGAFLFWKKTRMAAFIVAIGFHVAVGVLFPRIGVFPLIMIGVITIFFNPSWPRRIFPCFFANPDQVPAPDHKPFATFTYGGPVILSLLLIVELILPLRAFTYPGHPNWTDDGFKFSWRVMLIDRTGYLRYIVHFRDGSTISYEPRDYLTSHQYHLLSTSPDMVVSYAKDLAKMPEITQHGEVVSVTADSRIALNQRPSQVYVDPEVNLLEVKRLQFHHTFLRPPLPLPR